MTSLLTLSVIAAWHRSQTSQPVQAILLIWLLLITRTRLTEPKPYLAFLTTALYIPNSAVKQLSDDNHRAKFHCITNRLARFPPIHLGNSRQYCAEQDDVFHWRTLKSVQIKNHWGCANFHSTKSPENQGILSMGRQKIMEENSSSWPVA